MKKKLVEETVPVLPKKARMGWWLTVQQIKDILVINTYNNKTLKSRHCINIYTYEYMTLKDRMWNERNFSDAVGLTDSYYITDKDIKEHVRMSKEDEQTILKLMKVPEDGPWINTPYEILMEREREVGQKKRIRSEMSRVNKVKAVMNLIPEIPVGLKEWINQKEIGGEDYALKNRETKKWSCSHCGKEFEADALKKDGIKKKIKNNDIEKCPCCGKQIRFLTRKKYIDIMTHFAIVQPLNNECSVIRHFDAEIYCTAGRSKEIGIDEAVRIVMMKKGLDGQFFKRKYCDIYYNQWPRGAFWASYGQSNNTDFDNKSNPANRREYAGYLYDDGIEEAFKGTTYEYMTKTFILMAKGNKKINYNGMMVGHADEKLIDMAEMLYKGRFYLLLRQTTDRISYWDGKYYGGLKLEGNRIEDVFEIEDKQKINRIRNNDGGEMMIEWMKWSDRHNTKITETSLVWLINNNLKYSDMKWLVYRMSTEKAMNYIERQRKESYKGFTIKETISQYEDYMEMCKKLHKDTSDEMIYRPRELKRRHDEAVSEIERRRAELKAEEYSEKFAEAEKILGEISQKFEYTGEKYLIKVPERIVDIVAEGNYLHHCAGATDRYFDRIKQHETYICFMRKTDEPDIPYYTIEVEPGGTIRQHRGMYDEEPDIENVKEFLKEWQKEIRKRMKKRDHRLAAVSKEKRMSNIEDLKRKNNTRVLNGLLEDFMEAM